MKGEVKTHEKGGTWQERARQPIQAMREAAGHTTEKATRGTASRREAMKREAMKRGREASRQARFQMREQTHPTRSEKTHRPVTERERKKARKIEVHQQASGGSSIMGLLGALSLGIVIGLVVGMMTRRNAERADEFDEMSGEYDESYRTNIRPAPSRDIR